MASRRGERLLVVAIWVLTVGCALKGGAPTNIEPPASRIEITDLNLFGVDADREHQLREVLQTKPGSWWPWAEDRYFDQGTLQQDLQRILAFYRDKGFPDARIVSHGVDIDESAREARVTISIAEGEPIRVADIVLTGFSALSPEEQAELRERLPLTVGEPLARVELAASADLAAQALNDRGYPYTEVAVSDKLVAPRGARVVFDAKPGPRAWFGSIDIVGNVSVGDEVIRRELRYRPGEQFQRRLLQESHRNLYTLGLFRFANIEIIDAEKRPSEVKTRVTVVEADHSRIWASVGYGTEEKVRAEFSWRNVNFLGGARTLGVRTTWSGLTRGAELDLVQPYFFHPRLSLSLDGHYMKEDEAAYDLTARGGIVSLIGELDAVASWQLTLLSEDHVSQVSPAALANPTLRDELIALGLDPETGRAPAIVPEFVCQLSESTPNGAGSTGPQRSSEYSGSFCRRHARN